MQDKRQRAADLAFCLPTRAHASNSCRWSPTMRLPSLPLSPAAHRRTDPHKAGLHVSPGGPLAAAVWSWCRYAGWRCLHGSVGGCSSDWYFGDPQGYGRWTRPPQPWQWSRAPVSRQVAVPERVETDGSGAGGPWPDHCNAVSSKWSESERASRRNSPSELCQRGKQRAKINDLFSFQLSQQ